MALAEICGMQDFDGFRKECTYQNDIFKFSKNFDCHSELAVPPFPNVSTVLAPVIVIYYCLILQPAENLSQFTRDENGREIKIKFDHGTTTLGFMYQGGVVLSVDSRATGGEFIGSQTMKKIVEINDFLLGNCIPGIMILF